MTILGWIVAAVILSEFFGYVLHRLLHSGRIGWLSRSHMVHHLVLYGPLDPKRPDGIYLDATSGRMSLGNIGLEWLLPGAVLFSFIWLAMKFAHVPLRYQATVLTTVLVWSFTVFSYLHDRMHVRGFWMEHVPGLRRWYLKARKLHDIHHWTLNDEGVMNSNFGIGFHFFDHLFGTHAERWQRFNKLGYVKAYTRFLKGPGSKVGGVYRRTVPGALSEDKTDIHFPRDAKA